MVGKKASILIVDDEQVVCDVLHDKLNNQGYQCATALNGNIALTKLATKEFNVVLLDIKLPGMSGMEVLRKIQSNRCNTAVIMITAVNDVDTAVEAMKWGASDYIVKPFKLDKIETSICTALESEKRFSERNDCEMPRCVGHEEKDKQAMGDSFYELNTIARGVEAKLDLLICHSKTVTKIIIEIARGLGIPEEEIQRWVTWRARLHSERNKVIKSSLDKLEQSPLAQSIMGMTELHLYRPKPKEYQN